MKVRIDQDVCIGCGLCPELCPEAYEMEGDRAVVILESIPPELEDSARQAVEQCPVDAILEE